jgi:hypothetical protein
MVECIPVILCGSDPTAEDREAWAAAENPENALAVANDPTHRGHYADNIIDVREVPSPPRPWRLEPFLELAANLANDPSSARVAIGAVG